MSTFWWVRFKFSLLPLHLACFLALARLSEHCHQKIMCCTDFLAKNVVSTARFFGPKPAWQVRFCWKCPESLARARKYAESCGRVCKCMLAHQKVRITRAASPYCHSAPRFSVKKSAQHVTLWWKCSASLDRARKHAEFHESKEKLMLAHQKVLITHAAFARMPQ